MTQKTGFKIFGNIGYWYQLSIHEWPTPKKPYCSISSCYSFFNILVCYNNNMCIMLYCS